MCAAFNYNTHLADVVIYIRYISFQFTVTVSAFVDIAKTTSNVCTHTYSHTCYLVYTVPLYRCGGKPLARVQVLCR